MGIVMGREDEGKKEEDKRKGWENKVNVKGK